MKKTFIIVKIFLLVNISIAQIETSAINYKITAYKVGSPQVVSQSNEVVVYSDIQLIIANAFKHNGDGINKQIGSLG